MKIVCQNNILILLTVNKNMESKNLNSEMEDGKIQI